MRARAHDDETSSSDSHTSSLRAHTHAGLDDPLVWAAGLDMLHPDVDEAKLMEVFSLAGEVKKIDCHPTYRQAKIEFDHALEAVQAVSMLDRQKLYDKQLAVRMDELPRKRTLPQGLAGVGQGLGKHGQALRGCRIFAELRRLYEIFTDLGRAEKERNDVSNPFKFRFELIKPKNVKADSKSDKNRETIVVRDSSPEPTFSRTYDLRKKPSTSSASRSSTPNSSKASESSSKDAKKSSKAEESIPEAEGTLLAIQALGTVLVAQGLIPADTDCKSLQSILGALQKKTAAQQNLQNLNIGQAQVLNHALSTVMQYMATNPANAQNVQPVPVPAPVQPIPTPVQPIPAPVQPIPTPVQPIPAPVQPIPAPIQPIPAPVPPVRPENQSKWDIVGRQFPVLITPPTLVGQRMPATNPAPVPVRPQPRVSFPIQPRPTAPQRSVQPAYDNIRSNLRAVPTGAPVATQPVRPPAPKPTPSQQKPDPVRDSTKDKDANQAKIALEKEASQNKESFSKSEMLVFKDLPSCVTTEILQGKMREVGEVKFCEMTGRGRAFVRFKNPTDADRCIRILS
ncbi:hypothetical protein NE865_04086 [Phthorimaea operculella]|nr:hypothetical protein NE865_04086 [Phthorimaea operculella]